MLARRIGMLRVVLMVALLGGSAFAEPPTTESVVASAFGGTAPALPLLSADGKRAAVDVSEGLGMSSVETYEVGIVDPKSVVGERLVVVGMPAAKLIANGTYVAPPKDAAAKVTTRLAGFTPFAGEVSLETIRAGVVHVGTGTLAVEQSDQAGLRLRWLDAKGAVRGTASLAVRPREFTNRDGGMCGGTPTLVHAWWDDARGHVLAEVVFPGHDSCQDEPRAWLML